MPSNKEDKPIEQSGLELGVIMEQVTVLKRGLKDHPENEQFQKGMQYMADQFTKTMKEIIKAGKKLQHDNDR